MQIVRFKESANGEELNLEDILQVHYDGKVNL